MAAAASIPARKVWTDEEIMGLPDNGYDYEVVNGELLMSPKNNPEHSDICAEIGMRMRSHAKQHRLGRVWESNAGFWMVNGNLRAPDVSFIARSRLPAEPLKKFFHGAPDLAVEVLSYTNSKTDIAERLHDFFESGTRLAWVIDPETRTAEIHRPDRDVRVVRGSGFLEGEEVLPGLKIPLNELFEPWS